MTDAPVIIQPRRVACSALPTGPRATKSKICVGMIMANKAADWACRENHKMLRTSCPRIDSGGRFTNQTVLFSFFSQRKVSIVLIQIRYQHNTNRAILDYVFQQ
jgi:hypothetical protein